MVERLSDKPLFWIGSSREDLKDCSDEVQDAIGYALHWAQRGGKSPDAKPLSGFRGAGVLEIVEDYDGDTYRAVYTVRFKGAVYVLHVFQKKSRKGIATPKSDLDLVKARLKRAEAHYAVWSTKATEKMS
jgi:phage-related protein